ncbi:MAG TPA: response regulator transcription factor [Gaiellaceae bacterium]|nr:response regulator transcription factor [Gaiellaceae bacterium]
MSIHCLIVDDNPAFLEAARAFLERDGLTVSGLATNGAEAVQQADALRPDVILVDITLGQESGLDLARRLAEDGVGERATVILISTRSEEEVAELAAESPAAGYLPKAELSADAIRRLADGRADEGASGRPET